MNSSMEWWRWSNVIISINVNDVLVEGVEGVRSWVFQHFKNHFKIAVTFRLRMGNLSFKSISEVEEGLDLIKPFSSEEIKETMWDYDNFKNPESDGINLGFIKNFWDILKVELLIFSFFHRNGKLTKDINSTFITLIPKFESPQRLAEFRPISLVGCLHKNLSKVLANRLRKVVGNVFRSLSHLLLKVDKFWMIFW